ncbi:hypothetical protein SEVIR_9G083600v4 [Setaria viridis]|uniref:Uncharacterized protein n=2 Tax=Setaria TaxID=4554 RepID=A0A368SG83_SETIT|nr:hypothetical protein SETIT_9G085200v2 [Setaria italica]TKV91263.1 hypothetical protein SEVIR_9G083600v2 [Setaria viridis]
MTTAARAPVPIYNLRCTPWRCALRIKCENALLLVCGPAPHSTCTCCAASASPAAPRSAPLATLSLIRASQVPRLGSTAASAAPRSIRALDRQHSGIPAFLPLPADKDQHMRERRERLIQERETGRDEESARDYGR